MRLVPIGRALSKRSSGPGTQKWIGPSIYLLPLAAVLSPEYSVRQ